MKLIILTQEDSFTIPQNIEKIVKMNNINVLMVVNINSKFSLSNNKMLFLKGFGIRQVTALGLMIFINKLHVYFDTIFGRYINIKSKSLKSVAKKFMIPYKIIDNPNADSFLDELESIGPDLIVSFSAPLVFKYRLLRLPKYGCVNLHCSYLPHFAGVMPSFWTLYKKQKTTGVTVHYMDSKIDNGTILGQRKVIIADNETIFTLINRTKKIGGELMCEILDQIRNRKIDVKVNNVETGSYFGWPKVEDFQEFKSRGGKLI